MKTMEEVVEAAKQFLYESWREYIESGESEEGAQIYAWIDLHNHFGWRGIGEAEKQVIHEWFVAAMHEYFARHPETGEA